MSFFILNEVFSCEKENESIIRVKMGHRNPSLAITDCNYSASFVI